MNTATALPRRWSDWHFITFLLLAAIVLKSWLIGRSLMFARDGVGFIELAQCFKEEPWGEVMRKAHQHPLYPLNICATASLYERCVDHPLSNLDWLYCAHLANAWASALVCIPMYLLGKRLGGPWVGFGGTLLFIVLPMPAGVLADTLSEGTYLLCLVTGLWALTVGLETKRLFWFGTAGLFGGLAFLARPEGAMLPVVGIPIILAMKWRQVWPESWTRTLALATVLAALTLCVTVPYWATIGGFGKKNTFKEMLNVERKAEPAVSTRMLLASRFQPGVDGCAWDNVTMLFVGRTILTEMAKGFGYFAFVPALFGAWLLVRRPRLRSGPAGWVLITVGLLNWVLLGWLAWKAHYVSERHTILIVLFGCWLTMLALATGGAWLTARWPMLAGRARWLAIGSLALLLTAGLIEDLRPQHHARIAHREVGFWLKEHLEPSDRVVDPYSYAAFFAERRVLFKKPGTRPLAQDDRIYLVFEPGEKDAERLRTANKVKNRGEIVKQLPDDAKPRVVVYCSKGAPVPPALTAGK